VRTIVLIAHNLGMKMGGVETEAQLERLVTLGCKFVQGYCLSRPLTAADTTGFIIPSAMLAASAS
jgi:EAL domain-containing protein (putative c-di-GMP-specific phosphodiesterase class I)